MPKQITMTSASSVTSATERRLTWPLWPVALHQRPVDSTLMTPVTCHSTRTWTFGLGLSPDLLLDISSLYLNPVVIALWAAIRPSRKHVKIDGPCRAATPWMTLQLCARVCGALPAAAPPLRSRVTVTLPQTGPKRAGCRLSKLRP